MGVNPKNVPGRQYRPILESDIRHAQSQTRSNKEAARYLRVDYNTYKKYAVFYGLFDQHLNQSGRGIRRKKMRSKFPLEDIFAGLHPTYSHKVLKERALRAGYLEESCGLCGYSKKREFDNRCPLVLHCVDGNENNLALENLQLRCYNCTYLTTGKVSINHIRNPGVYDSDVLDTGITQEDIEALQNELMGE